MQELRAVWREAEASLRRSITLITLLFFTFELINRRSVSELSIFFVKVSRLQLIEQIIPIAIAYLLSTFAALLSDISLTRDLHDAIIRKRYPTVDSTKLHLAICPANSLIFSQSLQLELEKPGSRVGYLTATIFLARVGLLVVLPFALEVYTYIVLFSSFGLNNIVTWISAAISLLFVSIAIWTIFSSWSLTD